MPYEPLSNASNESDCVSHPSDKNSSHQDSFELQGTKTTTDSSITTLFTEPEDFDDAAPILDDYFDEDIEEEGLEALLEGDAYKAYSQMSQRSVKRSQGLRKLRKHERY